MYGENFYPRIKMNRHELTAKALARNVGKSVRSEDLGNYLSFFVDPIDSSALEGNTNQLIYGRRGSGKTLLLCTLNDRLQAEFPESKVMSFYFTATNFRSSPEVSGLTPSVKEKTHAFFHSFIEKLAHEMFDLADKVFKRPGFLASLTLAGEAKAARREAIASTVLELIEAAGYGAESPSPGAMTRSVEVLEKQSKQTGSSMGAGATARLSPRPSSNLDLSIKGQRQAATEKARQERVTIGPPRHFSPSRVRELLVKTVDLLELDHIVICIDEWMSLAECQVEFAERLRQCLFGDKRIAVKIAADQYQGQFNNSGQGHHFRGLEVGADIFVAVDLDRPFRDPSRRSALFAEALYRRLWVFEPELTNFFGPPPLVNRDRFIETVFGTRQAFAELCVGAQGLCRDFHLLVQNASKRVDLKQVPPAKIDFETVRRALVDITEQTYQRASRSIDSNKLLFRVITPHIEAAESRYFILETRPSSITPVVNELLSKRVINSIPSASLHPSVRGEYDCFEIAYGIYIDLMRAAEFSTDRKINASYDPDEVGTITSTNKSKFLLDLTPLQGDDADAQLLLCRHCDMEFLTSERSYKVRGICPHCFLDQESLSA
jgi:hypothetical protein